MCVHYIVVRIALHCIPRRIGHVREDRKDALLEHSLLPLASVSILQLSDRMSLGRHFKNRQEEELGNVNDGIDSMRQQ
jgi:hypothetical protein